jgi:hypothetical protein
MIEKRQRQERNCGRGITHSAEVRPVSTLGGGGGDSERAAGARAGADGGGGDTRSDSVGGGLDLAGLDLDASALLLNVDDLQPRIDVRPRPTFTCVSRSTLELANPEYLKELTLRRLPWKDRFSMPSGCGQEI